MNFYSRVKREDIHTKICIICESVHPPVLLIITLELILIKIVLISVNMDNLILGIQFY